MLNKKGITAFLCFWFLTIFTAFASLISYSDRPGSSGSPESTWPENSKISLEKEKSTIVIALHAGCPCSKATLSEYEKVSSRVNDSVTTYALLFVPRNHVELWESNPFKERLERIPGVNIIQDTDGELAHAFGIETSGHVLLYAPDGNLKFSGGITDGRAHEGTSYSETYLENLIDQKENKRRDFHVFGCHLFVNEEVQNFL